MLLRFKVKNFLSFHEETVFDTFPNVKRVNFSHHVYTEMTVPLLKQAVIYGANGSGKSNFIKAIDFLCSFVIYEDFLKTIDLDDYFFQLTKEKSQNISFEIEFFHEDEYYIYNADISKKEICEKLSKSGLGKTDSLIFKRRGTSIDAPSIQNDAAVKQLLSLSHNSSLLPLNMKFPVLSSKGAKHIYEWFSKKIEVISINSAIPALINVMSQNHEILSFANKVFENIGIGIKAVGISDTPFEKWIGESKNSIEWQNIIDKNPLAFNRSISQIKNSRNVLNIVVRKGTQTVQEFLFDQSGQSGYHKQMKITAQSDGTVRLLFLIPALYAAIHQGKTVFIDEIDNSIHPNLMFELLRFYANSQCTGQLIFTTHTTKFLNQQELLRPDEIWFTEKLDGNTRMYSLNDFKLHNTLNIENGYLDGRYGGAPVMDEIIPGV
ncbi:MAG: ATP-binding protein [Prevotellaceae bacterium]|jgi:AAA15 family ATPase/GTPase|nr:ATP-binding protein [Prevotellaceae bacterium]